MAAIIYLKEGLVKDALRTIRHGITLEQYVGSLSRVARGGGSGLG